MDEKDLEKRLIRKVRDSGGVAYKFISPGCVGVPDRLVVLPEGKVSFVEVKKPKTGRLSKLQVHELQKLTALGCKCYVLDEVEKIEFILEDMKK